MRYMTLKNIKVGMQMAKPLIDENGNILLKAGNQVSSAVYNRIQQMQLQGVYVHDEVSAEIEVEDLIHHNLKSDALKALLSKNIKQSIILAKQIVEDLRTNISSKVNLIDIKNNKNFPQKHCVSVCVYSVIIGMAMKLSVEQLNNLAVAAMLHDIAKFDLPDSLLYKPGPLTPAEEKIMKQLPKVSYEKLSLFNEISSQTRHAILMHHENEDGSGYPFGKKGNEIHLLAKIVHVANSFDALISPTFKTPTPIPEAIAYIIKNVGTIFNKEVVAAFISKFVFYPAGTQVKLSNGEMGIVVSNDHNTLRPIIRLLNEKLNYPLVDLSDNKEYLKVNILGIE